MGSGYGHISLSRCICKELEKLKWKTVTLRRETAGRTQAPTQLWLFLLHLPGFQTTPDPEFTPPFVHVYLDF